MKNQIFKLIGFALALATISIGCNYVDEEINIDPNNPVDVTVDLLLPSALTNYGFVLGGDFGRPASIWTQYFAGVERQHAGYEVYQLKEADVNNAWSNIYAEALQDLEIIENKASASESPHYIGVAKILKASIAMNLVDLFNDVPFSEANQGSENLTPSFDNAQTLYGTAITMLTEGISDVGAATSTFSPGGDDLLFGGDMAKWAALAQTLIARNYINQGALDASNYGKALDAVSGAIAGNDGNALIPFEFDNPYFAFNQDRGDVDAGSFAVELLKSLSDPRISEYYTLKDSSEYLGAVAGVPPTDRSFLATFGPAWGGTSSPVAIATVWEVKFIEAEAAFRTSNPGRAAMAHNAAIQMSLDYYGITDAAYIAAQASETETSITLEKILTQKYLALFAQLQPYNDFRRTGIPALTPANGQTAVATRFPYPSDERLFNADNYAPYAGTTNFDKVFWDQ